MDADELRRAATELFARPEIGSVEVLDAKTQSGRIAASTLRITSSLTFGSSNTASMTRSQAASAA